MENDLSFTTMGTTVQNNLETETLGASTPHRILRPANTTATTVGFSVRTWPGAVGSYVLLGLLFCFLGLEKHGYVSMEGMVEDTAAHMVESGDFWVPHLYGEMYTYKPPLAYWIATLPILAAEGVTPPWALRLPFASIGFSLGLFILFLIGRRQGPFVGLCCAIASCGSVLFLEKVRIGEFDTPLSVFVGLAVTLATVALADQRPARSSWFLCYGFLLLGLLSKGAPALMAFFPGLALAALITKRPTRLLSVTHLVAFGLFLGATAAYVSIVVSAAGWEAFVQPAHEAKVRGFEWSLSELIRTLSKPPQVLAAFVPFSLLLPLSYRIAKRENYGQTEWTVLATRSGLSFFVGGLLAFVFVPTHEMRYYLPLAASLGLCTGLTLNSLFELKRAPKPLAYSVRFLAVLTTLCAPVTLFIFPSTTALMALVILAAVCVALAWSRERRGREIGAAIMAFAVFIACAQALVFIPNRAAKRDLAKVAHSFRAKLPTSAVVWTRGSADKAGKHSSLHTNLDRRVLVFGEHDPQPPRQAQWWITTSQEMPQPPANFRLVDAVTGWSSTYQLFERRPEPTATDSREIDSRD